MRIDKYLCDMNVGSRSQVKKIIRAGLVSINSNFINKPETHIDENVDQIYVDGKLIEYKKYRYYMLNKPQGVVTAVEDKRDKTVMDLFDNDIRKGLFPVGRLDKDTEGLLLITNDGILQHNLTSPVKHIDKTYFTTIDGKILDKHIQLFKEGLDIGDKKITKPAHLEILERFDGKSDVLITITEGRFHQVKRMFNAVGFNVIYLKRVSMGKLKLDNSLKLGEYRELTDSEIHMIGGNI